MSKRRKQAEGTQRAWKIRQDQEPGSQKHKQVAVADIAAAETDVALMLQFERRQAEIAAAENVVDLKKSQKRVEKTSPVAELQEKWGQEQLILPWEAVNLEQAKFELTEYTRPRHA